MANDPAKKPSARGRWFVVAFVAVLFLVSGTALYTNLAREQRKEAAIQQGLEPLRMVTASGAHRFQVEVMRTDAERSRGLMFRQSMPQDRGMLFDFKVDAPVTMWMKNTYIPLDMIFIRADGVVHRIEQRTEPLSERTIASGAPVRSVLELNAGVAERIGLKPGDRVEHAMFPAR